MQKTAYLPTKDIDKTDIFKIKKIQVRVLFLAGGKLVPYL